MEVTDSDTHPDGTAALRKILTGAGVALLGHDGLVTEGLPGAGHILLVEATGEETYDLVRDSVAGLGLGLVRMEQRRHQIAEVFRTEQGAARTEAVPAQAPTAGPGTAQQGYAGPVQQPYGGPVQQAATPGPYQQEGERS